MFDEKREEAKRKAKEIETIKVIYEDGREKEIRGSVWTVVAQNDTEKTEMVTGKCIILDKDDVARGIRHMARLYMVYEDLAEMIMRGTKMDIEELEAAVELAKTVYRLKDEGLADA